MKPLPHRYNVTITAGEQAYPVITSVWLVVPPETDPARAQTVLETAEKACLVGNSLRFKPALHVNVSVKEPVTLPRAV